MSGLGGILESGAGENNELLQRWFDGITWTGPVSLGGTLGMNQSLNSYFCYFHFLEPIMPVAVTG